MARAAVRGRLGRRLGWRVARLLEARDETPSARTLVLGVDGWPGHVAGQHVDVRLTAEDGYSTQRSYSLAAPADGDRVELTVQLVRDGEVSPYLVRDYGIGDPLELRGPVGGWFSDRAEADMTSHHDGNALAGPLAEVFAVDCTAALTTCVHCGRTARVAELHVYLGGPGMVARCAGCDHVVARYVRTRTTARIDLRGTVALTIPLDAAEPTG